MFKRLLLWMQPVLVAAAVIVMGWLLQSQWQELRTHAWRFHAGWLAASAVLLLAAWAIEIAIWRSLVAMLGGDVPLLQAGRIWFLSAVVRYVPGNVWQPLSMTLYCRRFGIRPEATVTSVALYQMTIMLAASPIAALYFAATGNWGLLTRELAAATPWLAALVLSPVLAFVVRPDWLMALINWLLTKVGRQALDTRLTRRRLLWLLAAAGVDWLVWGLCFATLVFGISVLTPGQQMALLPHLVASYAMAYAIGFLSFITPSGFGVREAAFYWLLTPLMGGSVVTVVALAMRLWTMAGELLMALAVAPLAGSGLPTVAPPTLGTDDLAT